MKQRIIGVIIIAIVCTAFTSKKVFVTDYRDSYTGIYLCHYSSKITSPNQRQNIVSSDTISIIVSKDAIDSIVQLNIGGKIVKAKLKSGALKAYPLTGHYGGKFYASDSLDFIYSGQRISTSRYLGRKN